MVSAPGMVRWAVAGYWNEPDRPALLKVIASWGVPEEHADQLLSGKVPYTIEGETVVFTIDASTSTHVNAEAS